MTNVSYYLPILPMYLGDLKYLQNNYRMIYYVQGIMTWTSSSTLNSQYFVYHGRCQVHVIVLQ